jgi:PIF1 helicase.
VAERYRDAFYTMCNDGGLQHEHVPLTFITGQAGAGKTYLLNALSEMSKIISSVSKGALKLTHTGVAAANCGGYTLYILGIPITLNACGIDTATHQAWRALPIERAMQLQDQYDFKEGHYSMVILDEFPTIDPVNFTAIEKRISELFSPFEHANMPHFAGLPTILAGDFCQHEPTKKAGIAQWIE